MAYTAGALHLRAGAPGELTYTYDAGSDTMATVAVAGYFNNTDDNLNLTVEDVIYCQCTDGNFYLKVSAISASDGSVTTQFAGGDLPVNTAATGTEAALSAAVLPGFMEVGTSIATATRYVLPTPYAGARVMVNRVDSGTQAMEFDAGGSGATGVTYDGSARRIMLKARTEGFHVRATSATRWRIENLRYNASAVSEGGSVVLLGT